MMRSLFVLTTVVCVVAAQSYTTAGVNKPSPGGTYPYAGTGPYPAPSQSSSQPSESYSPSKGPAPEPAVHPTPVYTPDKGSAPGSAVHPTPVYTPAKGPAPVPAVHPTPVYTAGKSYGNYADTPQVRFADNKLISDLSDVKQQAADRTAIDNELNITLTSIGRKIPGNLAFRKEFELKILPAIEVDLKKVDDRIANFKAQLEELGSLVDVVNDLRRGNDATEKLEADLKNIRTHRAVLLKTLTLIKNFQTDHITDVDVIGARIKEQEESIIISQEQRAENLIGVAEIETNLKKVLPVINKEKAEFFTIYLSKENKTVNFKFEEPFAETPSIAYGIISAHHRALPSTKSGNYKYGKGDDNKDEPNQSIVMNVKVTGDRLGGTATLIDNGNKWTTDFAIVRIVAFIKDNRTMEYENYHNHNNSSRRLIG